MAQWGQNRAKILDQIRQHFAKNKLAVRSSTRSEDSFLYSNAGGYKSLLNVDPDSDLEAAIEQVIASYNTEEDADQVLIQPMVTNVTLSGVAFTRTLEHGAPWYVVNYETNGNTETITSGTSHNHKTFLLRRDVTPETLPDPQLAPLVNALREIETLLSYDDLDVEFAIDSNNLVHLLQVRPIAVDRKSLNLDDANFDYYGHCPITMENACRSSAPPPGNASPLYGVMPDWNPARSSVLLPKL